MEAEAVEGSLGQPVFLTCIPNGIEPSSPMPSRFTMGEEENIVKREVGGMIGVDDRESPVRNFSVHSLRQNNVPESTIPILLRQNH